MAEHPPGTVAPDRGYVFKPHDQPFMPGSPATPDHPGRRKLGYAFVGLFLAIVGGLQNGLLIANLTVLQSNLALTPVEGGWVSVAFNMTNACMSMLLFKVRQEFGIQRFVRTAMAALLLANFVQMFDAGYHVELLSRGIAGIAGSCLSTLATFYLMQAMSGPAKIVAVLLGMGLGQIAIPMARAMSPALLVSGDIDHLFQLQFGLSLVAFGMVRLLPLPPGVIVRSFEKLDFISFPLLALGIGLLCAFLVQGRTIWWDKPWLGVALAGAIVCIGLAFLIEHNRANPMLKTRWMSSGTILAFAGTGAMVRVLLSEQNFGATALMATVGMVNEQLVTYYWWLTLASLLGLILSIVRLDPTDLTRPVLVAFGVITLAAFLDTRSGVLTRPSDLYWTQAMMAFASVYVMAPLMLQGIMRALSKGPDHFISFVAVFGLSQTLGGLAGVAALSALHTVRMKAHLMTMGQDISLADPSVANAIGKLVAAQGSVQSDAVLRQATGASTLVQYINQQAAIMAFNDVFFALGCLSGAVFVLFLVRWIYLRRRGINPLAKEMAALQELASART